MLVVVGVTVERGLVDVLDEVYALSGAVDHEHLDKVVVEVVVLLEEEKLLKNVGENFLGFLDSELGSLVLVLSGR